MKKLITILGPTASGKTDMAVKLALKFKGEVVSADSRQIYKKLSIGTAKPILDENNKLEGIKHYLIDMIDPDKPFNAALYKKEAQKCIEKIYENKNIPFLVGGTGLYIKAVVDNMSFPNVKPNEKLRKKLENKDWEELLQIYKKLDLKGSEKIEQKNKRRLIRAIEVCTETKKPYWEQRKKGDSLYDVLQIGIKLNYDSLQKNIEKRTKKMFEAGLEKEVKHLYEKYGFEISPMQTIGYREFEDYFKGKIPIEEVCDLISLNTLRFAKRQMTWFKADRRIHWVERYDEAEKIISEFIKK